MALDYVLDSLEGLEESVQALYVEKDGSFLLDVSGIDTGDELKGALEKEREARRKAERKLKKEGDLKSEQERKALEKKEEYKTLYETEKEANKGLRESGKKNEKSSFANGIVAELTTDTKRAKVLKKQILSNIDFDKEGEIEIVGVAGVSTTSEFISHLKKEYDFLIDGSKASGGGSKGGEEKHGGDTITDPIARLQKAREKQT